MAKQESRCSFPRETVTACGVRLLTMWRVRAGADYRRMAERSRHDSHVKIHQAGKNVVAVRTDSGEGVLVAKGQRHVLGRGSLLLFDFPTLEEYHTHGRKWCFWWVEFATEEPLHLPLHQTLEIPTLTKESSRLEELYLQLQSERLENRCLAASMWQALYHEWWSQSGISQSIISPEESVIQRVIDAIKRSPGLPWTIKEMAATGGMSAPSLRLAFLKVLGKSPCQIRNSLRLAHAFEYLLRGDRNVAEVASELGFCDPFHFSKVFKNEFGYNPSAVHRCSLR